MTNKHRSEKIFIFGDKGWHFRCTLQILAEFEGESGFSLSELIEKLHLDLLPDSDYLALEQVIRRNLRLKEPFSGRQISSFKKQIKELLLEIFAELNPGNGDFLFEDRAALDIPWDELAYLCVYHLKIPFEQYWNMTLPEVKILLHAIGGTIYSKISPAEIKEMRDILTTI